METQSPEQRRIRTHAIVEGALLADIALVFLLMRAFLPVPGARQLIQALATIPFVLLVERRGVRLTILASISSFILLSALIGPLLGMAAVNTSIAGLLIGIGRKWGLGPVINTFFTGPIFAFFDLLIPTVVSIWLFHYPIDKLIGSAKNFIRTAFDFFINIAKFANVSRSGISALHDARAWSVLHWQVGWLLLYAVLGVLTTYLAVIAAEIVLKQLPPELLARQRVGA